MNKASKLTKHFRKNKPRYMALLFNLGIIVLFLLVWFNSAPLNSYPRIDAGITVDRIDVCYWGSTHVHVYCGSDQYIFPNTGIGTKYPGAQLEEQIRPGDTLSVTYIVKKGFFGSKRNTIIRAQNDTQVLRTQEELGEIKGLRTIVLISFVVVEVLYIATALFILHHLYPLPRKKKHHR